MVADTPQLPYVAKLVAERSKYRRPARAIQHVWRRRIVGVPRIINFAPGRIPGPKPRVSPQSTAFVARHTIMKACRMFHWYQIPQEYPGQEIEYPMAFVILGGWVTATLLNLFLLPIARSVIGRPEIREG